MGFMIFKIEGEDMVIDDIQKGVFYFLAVPKIVTKSIMLNLFF